MKLASYIFVVAATFGVAACSSPGEEVGAIESNLDSRFDPSYPRPVQGDDWTCSVHTTTWMLQATGHDVSFTDVKNRMLNTGRVSPSWGLSDANGPGVAQTLRDFAGGAPHIENRGIVSFDDVAARAGHMAVGIGGRSWYHWSAVRGYDADRDVILLANSANGWKGVYQEMTRGQFANLGAMAMVWMDFGQLPPPAPFEPSPRPSGGPFDPLHVKTKLPGGQWITQCNESGDGERVWQSTDGGPDPETRWAEAKYPQEARQSCGEARDGRHPVVFRSESGDLPVWVTQCTGTGEHLQHVYHVETEVDGHPAAVFLYNEPNGECD